MPTLPVTVRVPPTAAFCMMRSPVPAAVIVSGPVIVSPALATFVTSVVLIPVSPAPSPWKAVAFTVPTTSNACVGVVVPRPTWPVARRRSRSVGGGPPGEKPDVALLVQLQQVTGAVEHQLMRVVEGADLPLILEEHLAPDIEPQVANGEGGLLRLATRQLGPLAGVDAVAAQCQQIECGLKWHRLLRDR